MKKKRCVIKVMLKCDCFVKLLMMHALLMWVLRGNFTWYNGREGEAAVWERLDTWVINENWKELFPTMHCIIVS